MAVTITPVSRGTVPGDGTGDTAYDGTGTINTNFSNLKAAADLVLDVPETYMLGRVTASTGDAEQLTPVQVRSILDLPKESGFIDRADSTLSFVDGTRTFTIQPSATSYQYWENNVLYTKSGADNVVITDVEGLHYIYFDGTTLTHTTTFTPLIITEYAFVCAIYWDATNNTAVMLGEERHGHIMDSATHIYNHLTFGARYGDGLAIGNINTAGTGSAAGDAQFSVASGSIWDEDIQNVITDGSPQVLSTAAEIPIVYRSGASGDWRKIAATTYPIDVGATPLARFNEWTGATWQMTEITSGNYVLYHYYATNDILEPIIAIPGIAQYNSLADAQAAADNELFDLAFGALEDLIPEFVPIATVIWESRTSFTNAVASRTRPTQEGDDYIDWRGTSGGGAGGAGGGTDIDPDAIHVNIGSEIQPITIKNTPVSADVLVIEDSAALWAKKSITVGSIPHDSLSGYQANEHIDWTSATQNLSTSGTLAGSNFSGSHSGTSSGTNTGDQPDMSAISDTKANFNTSLSDGTFMFTGDAPTAHNHDWSDITTGTPTTLSGYGISDTMANFDAALSDGNFSYSGHTHTFASLTSKPTTLSGYGISDTKANFNTALSDGTFMYTGDAPTAHTHTESDITDIGTHTHTFASLTSKPTTMSGYGISDVKANFNTALSNGSFMFVGDAPTAHTHVEADITDLTVYDETDFVDLTSVQTAAGAKTWSDDAVFNDLVSIGMSSPESNLHVRYVDYGQSSVMTSIFERVGGVANVRYRRANGTIGSETATLLDDVLGNFSFGGYNTTAGGVWNANASVTIRAYAAENHTSTAYGGRLGLGTVPTGGTASVDHLVIEADGTADFQANNIETTGNIIVTGGTISASNLSGSNTGDQTSIVGITGTIAQFNSAVTNATLATGGGTATGTNTGDEPTFAGSTAGIVPSSAGGTTNYLRADGSWAQPPGTGTGTVTNVTVGTGLDVTNGTTTPNITLDFSELSETTAWDHTGGTITTEDSLIMWDISTLDERRILLGNIPISGFNNDAGFTSNTGDITGVTAGTGLSGGGTSGSVSLALDFVELSTVTTSLTSSDYIIALDGTLECKVTLANLANELEAIGGWVGSAVTSVAAGNGMSFTTITGTGSVTMGTPGTLSGTSTNSVTSTSHTHAVTFNEITVATTTDTTTYPVLVGSSTAGAKTPLVDAGLAYNASTNSLSATTFNATSARDRKELVEYIDHMEGLDKLRPIRYKIKEIENAKVQLGLYADEVEDIFPEIVSHDDSGKAAGIDYSRLVIPLIMKVRELESRLAANGM